MGVSKSDPEWFDLYAPPKVLRLDLLMTTGQAFCWRKVGAKHWVGVLDSSVYEMKQDDNTTLYRTIYGKCSRERLWEYFDLNHEYMIDYNKLSKPVQKLFKSCEGVRILQQDPLECVISFICSANNNIGRITRLLHEFRKHYGTFLISAEFNDELLEFYKFPTLEQLSKVTPEFLRSLGFGYRSDYIYGTVRILNTKGPKWLYNMRNEDVEYCRKSLTALPGVGRKVADCIMLFGLGKREVVPVDVHIKRVAESYLSLKPIKTLNDHEYERIGEAFRKFAGENAGWAQAVLFINSITKI